MNPPQIASLHLPEAPLPLVFDSPHSGRDYPADFGFACPLDALRRAEDNHVDELFAGAPDHGGVLLCALFPRTYIDVNRAGDDLDPDLLAGDWPHAINPTPRSHAGIGLIRRLVRPGIPVYDRKLNAKEISYRLEKYYKPYHDQLAAALDRLHYDFGQVWHVNCHSMPRSGGNGGTGGFARPVPAAALMTQPDFVLGDRDGTSCNLAFTHALRDYLRGRGFLVTVNNPYRGVEIVRRHASPATGRHSLQLEIAKALYWDEDKNEKSKNFNDLRDEIDNLVKFCAGYVTANLTALAAD